MLLSSSSPASCATETNSHCRYPAGIETPRIGETASPLARLGVNDIEAKTDVAVAAARKMTDIRFMDDLSSDRNRF
jgi:hypothetical protein